VIIEETDLETCLRQLHRKSPPELLRALIFYLYSLSEALLLRG
jgi:hypothetical protein